MDTPEKIVWRAVNYSTTAQVASGDLFAMHDFYAGGRDIFLPGVLLVKDTRGIETAT